MVTLAEFLRDSKNQSLALAKIVDLLRQSGEWGTHGLFAKIGKKTDISPAYVGRALTGKNRLTENFLEKIGDYLGHSRDFFSEYIRGEAFDGAELITYLDRVIAKDTQWREFNRGLIDMAIKVATDDEIEQLARIASEIINSHSQE